MLFPIQCAADQQPAFALGSIDENKRRSLKFQI